MTADSERDETLTRTVPARLSHSDPLHLVEEIERLLAERHHAAPQRWDPLSDELAAHEQELLRLPLTQLRSATDALLTLLHNVVEAEGLTD